MRIINPPKYLTQRDNLNLDETPNHASQCMISSFTMFYNWCAATFGFIGIDEFAYLDIVTADAKLLNGKRFDWEVHADVMNKVLAGQNVKEKIYIEKTLDSKPEIIAALNNNIPVPMSINISDFYKGAKGHIVLCIGYNESGLFFHDPFGNANTKYQDHNGESVFYSQPDLQKMFDSDRRCAILK